MLASIGHRVTAVTASALAALQFLIDAGADEAIGEAPVDRTAPAAAAPAAAAPAAVPAPPAETAAKPSPGAGQTKKQ